MADTTDAMGKPKAARAKAPARAKPAQLTDVAPAPAGRRSPIAEQLQATRDTIRTEAQRKAGELGDEFGRLSAQAGEKAKDIAVKGKTKAAEGLENLAKAIGDSSTQVDERLGKQYGDFARSAAESVSGLAGSIDQKDLDELVAEAREFVRKSPAVAIGSAAVIGFMLARLLKSKD